MSISKILRPVLENAFYGGFKKMSDQEINALLLDPQKKINTQAFQLRSYEGWKTAQLSIAQEQLLIAERYPEIKKSFFGHYLFRCYQRIQDSIIWTLTCEDMYEAKRMFVGEPIISDLRNHNLKEHLDIATAINKEPSKCAIITDLSSGTKVGDLVVAEIGKPIAIHEIKSGGGAEIAKLMFDKDISEEERKAIELNLKSESKVKEVNRFIRQAQNTLEVQKLLKGEPGVDRAMSPKEMKRVLYTPKLSKQNNLANKILSELDFIEQDYSFEILDGCYILIAVDLSKFKVKTDKELHMKAESIARQNLNSEIPIVLHDWAMFLHFTSFTKPIFLHGIERENIDNLVDRKKALFVGLSLVNFVSKYNCYDCRIGILDKNNLRGKNWRAAKIEYGLEYKGYSIGFEQNENRFILSEGIYQRFVAELLSPSDLFEMHRFMLLQHKK